MAAEFGTHSSTQYGPVCPCPAWLRGVRVTRGPHFVWSGFEGQDVGVVADGRVALFVGWSVEFSRDTMEWLSQDLWDDVRGGGDGAGYWYPHRSLCVAWPHEQDTSLYKAGDDGMFDVGFWPLELALRSDEDIHRFYTVKSGEMLRDVEALESVLHLRALRHALRFTDAHRRYAIVDGMDTYIHAERMGVTRTLLRGESHFRKLLLKAQVFQARTYPAIPLEILDTQAEIHRRLVHDDDGLDQELSDGEDEQPRELEDMHVDLDDDEQNYEPGDEEYWQAQEFENMYVD